jgi:protein O-GlcNAc transferase
MGFLRNLFKRDMAPANPGLASPPIFQTAIETDYERLRSEANSFLNKGDLQQAILLYEAAAQAAPGLAEAHINLGYALAEMHKHPDALSQFSLALGLDARSFDAHLLMATSKLALEDYRSALKSLERALELQPESRDAIDLQLRLFALTEDVSSIDGYFRRQLSPDKSQAHQLVDLALGFITISEMVGDKKNFRSVATDYVEKALCLQSNLDCALNVYGFLLIARGDFQDAVFHLQRAIVECSDISDYHCNLGTAYQGTREFRLAKDAFRAALSIDAKCAKALLSLGDLEFQFGELQNAICYFNQVLAIEPKNVDIHLRLSSVHIAAESSDLALQFANSAVEIAPSAPSTHFCKANVLAVSNQYEDAVNNYLNALALRPDYVDAKVNLGGALLNLGQYSRAKLLFNEALQLDPDNIDAASNSVYCASFDPASCRADYMLLARNYGRLASAKATPYTHAHAVPSPSRPIRVGLVSGDFCLHPVGFFLESILAIVDSDQLEFHAFSNRDRNDSLAIELRRKFASWTTIKGMDDATAARTIYDSKLDLLIDLSGHTNHNRLCLFSWRPAPVQATWLGYWASTGVAEIDYVLTDRHTVTASMVDAFTENTWCLGDTRLCFTLPTAAYDLIPSDSPATIKKRITFGCYQPLRKLTDTVFETWGEIFKQLPQARLRLQGSNFTNNETKASILSRLRQFGISEDRIFLFDGMRRIDYLKSYEQVDIVLDSFPYPGGTTTCDALWMGVPTVTLAGTTMLSRQGAGMMLCAGLSDWVANDVEQYVAIAVKYANNIPNLERIRKSLRRQVLQSPLFDAPAFAKNLETSLRAMVLDKLGGH